GDSVAEQGTCISAVGAGAALGAARSDGTVEHRSDFDPATLLDALTTCPITLVDIGSLSQNLVDAARVDRLTEIDDRIGLVLAAAPAGADVIVASMSDDGRESRLRIALAKGPSFGAGVLLSPSTRQPALVVNNDL